MTELQDRIAALSPEQRARLEARMSDAPIAPGDQASRITPRDPTRGFPLGIAQQREWAIERIRSANNINSVVRIEGDLDLDILGRALTDVLKRHEVLRSTIDAGVDGAPEQIVHPPNPVPTPVVDLTHVPTAQQSEQIRRHCTAEVHRPFDANDPQRLRVSVLRLGPQTHVIVFATDHAASDAWSLSIVVRELITLYRARQEGAATPLATPRLQFGDFAAWQRDRLDENTLEDELRHWTDTLAGIPSPPSLPTDRPHPARPTYAGDAHIVDLPEHLTLGLRQLAGQERASLASLLLTGSALLVNQFLEDDDVVVGSLVSGRHRVETEDMVGCFANPVPLRVSLSAAHTLRDVVATARDTMSTAIDHQDLPFDRLVEALGLGREASQTSLSRLWINVLNVPEASLETDELRIAPEPFDLGLASVDLTITAIPRGDALQLQWDYMTEIFDLETVRTLAGHFQDILAQLVDSPDLPIRDLRLRSTPDGPPAPAPAAPDSTPFVDSFRAQAARTPEAPAVVYDEETISFADLDRASDRLAGRLLAAGATAETRVGILVDRSPHLPEAIMGVLKAGAAFVPIDPDYPPDRITHILSDAGAEIFLTQQHLSARLDGVASHAIVVDVPEDPSAATVAAPSWPVSAPSSAAYVIYTSGSTGSPKGVIVEHRSLSAYARDVADRLELSSSDRFLQFASLGFDVLVEELFPTWLAGGAVVIPARHLVNGDDDLTDLIEREGLTVIELPTAYWHEWTRELDRLGRRLPDCLRLVIIGGERVLPERLAMWQRLGVPLLHVYGITETTVSSTFFRLEPHSDAPWSNLPIGTPIPSADLRLLDTKLTPTPLGAVGELYIGGISLARGYQSSPALSSQRFVADPDADRPGSRLYRTGDLCRLRADGAFEFVARADQQLKIRGFRVEPAEIESALGRHPDITESVVTVHEPTPGDRRLIAYVVAAEGRTAPTQADLREFLEPLLPPYMIPAIVVELDALPVSPHGKLERSRLPEPDGGRPDLAVEYVAPRNRLQETLTEIVATVVGVEQVGIHDNFFDLGGDSIQAIQVVARAQEAGISLAPLDFFEQPTIALLSQVAGSADPDAAVQPRDPGAETVLSFDQERLWLEHQIRPHTAYHVGGRFHIRGDLDVEVLIQSLRTILDRHETLRTRFPVIDGRPRPVVDELGDWRPVFINLIAEEDPESPALVILDEEYVTPFDLAIGPLLRCTLIQISDRDHLLSITTHHMVSDNWSIGLFGHELVSLYEAGGDLATSGLTELPVQYRDFAIWQRDRLSDDALRERIEFWRQHLNGAPPAIALPNAPKEIGAGGGRHIIRMSPEQSDEILAACRDLGVTPFMLTFACLGVVLHRWSGQTDLTIGTTISGRTDVALESLIGCFIDTMPFRLTLDDNPDFTSVLRQARQVTIDGNAHSETPLDILVNELRVPRDPRRTPLFQVVLNYFALPSIDRFGDVELIGLPLPRVLSSFDLVFTAEVSFDRFHLRLEYDAEKFQPPMMETLLEHLETMLRATAKDQSRRILDYPLDPQAAGSSPAEIAGEAALPVVTTDQVAVTDARGDWTPRWLLTAAARIAERLGRGDDAVTVVRHSTARFLAVILGCRHAEREIVLVEPGAAPPEPGSLSIDSDPSDGVGALAYGMDAAGVFGDPPVTGAGQTVDLPQATWATTAFTLSRDDRFAVPSAQPAQLISALSTALTAGATLVMPDRSFTGDLPGLLTWLDENDVTVAYIDQSTLRTMAAGSAPRELAKMRHLFVDSRGDLLFHDIAALQRIAPNARCAALYRIGPDGRPAAVYQVPEHWSLEAAPSRAPLGMPVHPAVHLRHSNGQVATVGEVAEICVGDEHTGDLGRRWSDGTLEFTGRVQR